MKKGDKVKIVAGAYRYFVGEVWSVSKSAKMVAVNIPGGGGHRLTINVRRPSLRPFEQPREATA